LFDYFFLYFLTIAYIPMGTESPIVTTAQVEESVVQKVTTAHSAIEGSASAMVAPQPATLRDIVAEQKADEQKLKHTDTGSAPQAEKSKATKKNPALHALAGSIAGLFSKSALQPLDLIKTRMQVQEGTVVI
jgi:Mitochondrial carrier protein